jgi:nitroimidazol reductase NimA-like FMN-containing flavoprotein (pyridoxamine 5'-phosphate oxidase superfamily)
MNDQQRLNNFLSRQQFMVLAVTLDDGTPWATPVRIQHREGNVFEWDSATGTEHSKAIAARPDIAMTIYEKLPDSQLGLYVKGSAVLVEETKPGFARYRLTAHEAWMNDETFTKRKIELNA